MAMLVLVYSHIVLTPVKLDNTFPLSPGQVKQFLENIGHEQRPRTEREERPSDTTGSEMKDVPMETKSKVESEHLSDETVMVSKQANNIYSYTLSLSLLMCTGSIITYSYIL